MHEQATEIRIWARPKRVAFILNRAVPSMSPAFEDIQQYALSRWGGHRYVFAISNGESLTEDWWRLLQDAEPDSIVFVGPFESNLIESIVFRLLPIECIQDETAYPLAEKNTSFYSERLGSIKLQTVSNYVRSFLEGRQLVKFRIEDFESNVSLRTFCLRNFGLLNDELLSLIDSAGSNDPKAFADEASILSHILELPDSRSLIYPANPLCANNE